MLQPDSNQHFLRKTKFIPVKSNHFHFKKPAKQILVIF